MLKIILDLDGKETEITQPYVKGISNRKALALAERTELGELSPSEQQELVVANLADAFNDERVTTDALQNVLNYPAMGYATFTEAIVTLNQHLLVGGVIKKKTENSTVTETLEE